jgi:hypothetical protein
MGINVQTATPRQVPRKRSNSVPGPTTKQPQGAELTGFSRPKSHIRQDMSLSNRSLEPIS